MLKIHKMSARVPIGEREQVNDGGGILKLDGRIFTPVFNPNFVLDEKPNQKSLKCHCN